MTVMKTKADLVLHPIRLQILMMLAGKQKTSQQLAEDLRDIPQATLYRHINRLAEGGLIQVVEERQVRGAIEKVYTVDARTTTLTAEEMAKSSKDDHMRYFIAFIATLLDDFSGYIHHSETIDFGVDGTGYQKFSLELSDEEFISLATQLNAAFGPCLANTPRQDRRRRIFSTIIMPDVHEIRP